jgi:DNA-binding transcriptional MerR regulator
MLTEPGGVYRITLSSRPGRRARAENWKGETKIAAALTTSALEKKTGVNRTTIYFYVRQGLLPEPQRTATGRSLYTEDHVGLLRRIGELKREGYSLPDIKRVLEKEIVRVQESETDLAGLEDERVRAAILEVASDEFADKGYRGTHVMAIIQKLGINPHIFYRHFPSKLDLLIECFVASSPIPVGGRIPAPEDDLDPGEKTLRGLTNHPRWHELSAALQQAIRAEGTIDPQTARRLADVWDSLMVNVVRDLQKARAQGPADQPDVSNELLAYALIGSHRTPRVRASWDERFSAAELVRAQLFVVFAVTAALSGAGDVYAKVAAYEERIQEVTEQMPVLPPAL